MPFSQYIQRPGSRDIESPEDIIEIVDTFYAIALEDSEIGHFFKEVASVDLEDHLPRLYRFWCAIILGMPSYWENVFQPHTPLHQQSTIEKRHFQRWLALFFGTVDSQFEGPKADLAKKRARDIATAMAAELASMADMPSAPARQPVQCMRRA